MRPLADEIRPQALDQVAGQKHLLGPGALLRRLIEGCLLYTSDAADEL